MPFTISHPAVILPLRRIKKEYLSFTGLVVGSMVPDFEYFIRMRVQSEWSHTVAGLFYFDLPLGILLCWVFHNIVRDSFVINLPVCLKGRFGRYYKCKWNNCFSRYWYVVAYSVLLGAGSHLFWDAFTHQDGFFVLHIPMLHQSVEIGITSIPIFKMLQHGSTILGGMFIVYVLLRMPFQVNPVPSQYLYWWSVIFIVCGITFVRWYFLEAFNAHMVASVISALCIGLILTPLILNRLCLS